MAGHYRVIAPSAQVGQPEVKLGLIPGPPEAPSVYRASPVQRKPIENVCIWRPHQSARSACVASGIVDQLIEGDLRTGTIDHLQEKSPRLPISKKPATATRNSRPPIQQLFRRRPRPSPQKSCAVINRPTSRNRRRGAKRSKLPFAEGVQHERPHSFAGLPKLTAIESPDPRLLRRTRRHEDPRHHRSHPDLRNPSSRHSRRRNHGRRESPWPLANAGIPVVIKETPQEALDRGMTNIRRNYSRLPPEAANQKLALITPQLTFENFKQADIIVEAIFENLPAKQQVFRELDAIAKPSCVLATNTSSLNIDHIAAATQRPEMVIGLHFFGQRQHHAPGRNRRSRATLPE